MAFFSFIVLGLLAGILSGIIGIGGGIIIIPALVALFKFSQHEAQGTTLALMVPPIGVLAAWTYYRSGHVNLPAAGYICLGFLAGGWIGAQLAVTLSSTLLQKLFGLALLALAIRMILGR